MGGVQKIFLERRQNYISLMNDVIEMCARGESTVV